MTGKSVVIQEKDRRSEVVGRQRAALPALTRLVGLVTLVEGERQTLAVQAPFTGQQVGTVPAGTEADVEQALQRARQAQPSWARRPIAQRKAIFLRYHDLILRRQNELLDLLQLESGKARQDALEEVFDVALNCRHYAYRAGEYLKPKSRRGALPFFTDVRQYQHPVGVVGIIAPWNYPLTLAVSDAIPAWLAGNAVVLKPAKETPYTALLAKQLLQEAGLPPDLFQIVTGSGSQLGAPLIAGADFIGFTGSTDTGRVVARQAGEHLTKCSMELGGKNPMLVLNDADLDRAVAGAIRGCFSNAGQLCIAIERLYVQSEVYDRFLHALVAQTRALRLGPAFNYETDIGSLVSQEQLDKIKSHVQDAVDKGATVQAGGKARPDLGPFFYEPTILTDVTPEMNLFRQETFGPVISVYRFDTVEEAIEAANDSQYGLNASIWTQSVEYGRQVAQRLYCGTVNINDAYAAAWGSLDAPMGGVKNSGMGRRHGREGMLKYTEAQTVAVQRYLPLSPAPEMDVKRYARVMTLVLRLWKRIPGLR